MLIIVQIVFHTRAVFTLMTGLQRLGKDLEKPPTQPILEKSIPPLYEGGGFRGGGTIHIRLENVFLATFTNKDKMSCQCWPAISPFRCRAG